MHIPNLVICGMLMVLLSPGVLGLQCKSELNQPSDGWVLFRGTGLTYHYYDLNKKTSVEFPSLSTANNPLAKTVKALLTANTDYFAYTSDLKTATVSKDPHSLPNKNVCSFLTDVVWLVGHSNSNYGVSEPSITSITRGVAANSYFPNQAQEYLWIVWKGIVSVKSSGQGVWLMYSNVFFPPLSSDQKSIADPTSTEWTWLDVTPSKYAYFICVSLKGKHHLTRLMDLLASSHAFVHIRKMSSSSPFKSYITIDNNTPVKTLKNDETSSKKCRYSMPSGFDSNCYLSGTFSRAKITVFSRHRLITPNYHQFCFETSASKKAVLLSKPLWPNFPGSVHSQILAVTVPGAQPMACVGDLLMMRDKPGKSSLLVCFEHREMWRKLKLEGLESLEHCLPHETRNNITVLSTILPELPRFNVSYFVGGYYRRTEGSILKDKEMLFDDNWSINVKKNILEDKSLLYDPLADQQFFQRSLNLRPHRQRKTRLTRRHVTKVQDAWTFDQILRRNNAPVLALFCYDWCRFCRKFRVQFRKMANNPSLRHVTFVDVDLNLNHLPEAFNVLVSPRLRYKPASRGFNSRKKRFTKYDLAGYRTIEGELNFKNILKFVQTSDFLAISKNKDNVDWAMDVVRGKQNEESAHESFSLSANNSSPVERIVMKSWLKDDSGENNRGLWVGLFTSLIDRLVGKDKYQGFQITSDNLKDFAKDLQSLKHHKTEKQWMENPLVKNVGRDKRVYTRPGKKEKEVFKVTCDYVTMAIKDIAAELQRMTGRVKNSELQAFGSIKNNLDKYLKLLKGSMKKEKKLFVKPVQELLTYVGLLQPRMESALLICRK